MNDANRRLEDLLKRVLATEPEELDCDGFLARVSPYLERLEHGGTVSSELRSVSQHLSVCPECREEFDALVRACRE